MNFVEFRRLLISFLPEINIYPSFVPEGVQLPAVSYVNLADVYQERDISGDKTGKMTAWRITVVSKSYADMQKVKQLIDDLDNNSFGNFGRIFVVYSSVLPKIVDSDYINAVIDLRVY